MSAADDQGPDPRPHLGGRRDPQRLWSALDSCQHEAYARLVRALLLSACRRSEMSDLQGHEIADDVIVVPGRAGQDQHRACRAGHAGARRSARQTAIGLSTSRRRWRRHGRSPGFCQAKRRLDAAIAEQRARAGLPPMAGWRLHDLRRTARSLMAQGRRADRPRRARARPRIARHARRLRPARLPGREARRPRAAGERWWKRIINPPPANVVNIAARRSFSPDAARLIARTSCLRNRTEGDGT